MIDRGEFSKRVAAAPGSDEEVLGELSQDALDFVFGGGDGPTPVFHDVFRDNFKDTPGGPLPPKDPFSDVWWPPKDNTVLT